MNESVVDTPREEVQEYWRRRHEFDEHQKLAKEQLVIVTQDRVIPAEEYDGPTDEVVARNREESGILSFSPEDMQGLVRTLYKYTPNEHLHPQFLVDLLLEATQAECVQNRYRFSDSEGLRRVEICAVLHWYLVPKEFPNIALGLGLGYYSDGEENLYWNIEDRRDLPIWETRTIEARPPLYKLLERMADANQRVIDGR